MDAPAQQSAEHHYLRQKAKPASSETRQSSTASTTSPPQRQGDRGSKDDAASHLPIFVRYKDLVAAGIVDSYRQLYNLINDRGFPPGMLLSPNVRAWNVADIEAWLSTRPTARKVIAPHRTKETEEAA
jgi:predicted DNA-binding transcriptional regulator AlpA